MTQRLRPTLSKDGQFRADIKVTFRLSYADVLDAIAESQPYSGPKSEVPQFPNWPATRVQAEIRSWLWNVGTHVRSGLYEVSDERTQEWCEAMAAKVWPTT